MEIRDREPSQAALAGADKSLPGAGLAPLGVAWPAVSKWQWRGLTTAGRDSFLLCASLRARSQPLDVSYHFRLGFPAQVEHHEALSLGLSPYNLCHFSRITQPYLHFSQTHGQCVFLNTGDTNHAGSVTTHPALGSGGALWWTGEFSTQVGSHRPAWAHRGFMELVCRHGFNKSFFLGKPYWFFPVVRCLRRGPDERVRG